MSIVRINNCTITYEDSPDNGEALLLLNGVAMSIAHWAPMAAELGRDFRCISHDFRGQLLSDKPESSYSLRGHADDVKGLMDHLGIEQAHIVGTSYGAEIGMIFAVAYPEACLSLTLIDGVSELDPVLEYAVRSWQAAAATDPTLFLKTILPWNYSAAYLEDNRELFKAREESIRRLPVDYFKAFIRLCDAFLEIDLTEEIRNIACPALVIVGDQDILKTRKFSEIIANAIPNAELKTLPGAGHAAVIEQPAELSRMIREWLK